MDSTVSTANRKWKYRSWWHSETHKSHRKGHTSQYKERTKSNSRKKDKMVLAQGYINEQATQQAFIVYNGSQPFTQSSTKIFDSLRSSESLESFIPQWSSSLDTIQEGSKRLSRTNPNLSPPSPFSLDVFGENLDSIDVWAEADVFLSSRKNHHRFQRRSSSSSSDVTSSWSSRSSS